MDTNDTPQIFITEQPDWLIPMRLSVKYLTALKKSYNGGEQQTALSGRPKLTISYSASGLNRQQWAVSRAKSIVYRTQQVVVPIWTIKPVMVAVRTYAIEPSLHLFFEGSYVYNLQNDDFFLITSIVNNELFLSPIPGNSGTTPVISDTLIPCITGKFEQKATHQGLDSTSEVITITGT
jgi:hypothetical protein